MVVSFEHFKTTDLCATDSLGGYANPQHKTHPNELDIESDKGSGSGPLEWFLFQVRTTDVISVSLQSFH